MLAKKAVMFSRPSHNEPAPRGNGRGRGKERGRRTRRGRGTGREREPANEEQAGNGEMGKFIIGFSDRIVH